MTDSSTSKTTLALDFKSATLYAVRVVLHSPSLPELLDALEQRMADAAGFFEDEAVVVDASALNEAVDWKALLGALRKHQLRPIGVIATEVNLALARKAGLEAVDLSSAPARSPGVAPAAAKQAATPAHPDPVSLSGPGAENAAGKTTDVTPAATATAPGTTPTMIINRPLRSGQRIYARNTDLIVIGMVSQGAEVIADGNIHVYGPLRGKAMAGARGDTTARIFTTQLDPELLAIAGVYRVIESTLDTQVWNQPAIVQLGGETLQIVPLGTKG